jgi:hypothetical protein
MSWDDNVYDNPEKYGLETVGEVEWDDESYAFNITAIWRDPQDGQLYLASDSGCSCPSPFEDFDGLAKLKRVTRDEAIDELKGEAARGWVDGDGERFHYGRSRADREDAIMPLITKLVAIL